MPDVSFFCRGADDASRRRAQNEVPRRRRGRPRERARDEATERYGLKKAEAHVRALTDDAHSKLNCAPGVSAPMCSQRPLHAATTVLAHGEDDDDSVRHTARIPTLTHAHSYTNNTRDAQQRLKRAVRRPRGRQPYVYASERERER